MAPKKDRAPSTYLNNQMDYLNARDALKNYQSTYTSAKLALENTPTSSKNYPEVVANFKEADARIDSLQGAFNYAIDAATARYNAAKTKKSESKTAKKASDIQEQLTAAIANRDQRYTAYNLPVPPSVQSQISKLQDQLDETKTPSATGNTGATGATGVTGATGATSSVNLGGYSGIPIDESDKVYPPVSNIAISDYLISVNLGGVEKIKELQTALKAAGPRIYKGPIDGVYRAPELTLALQQADEQIGYYEDTGITFKDRLSALQRLATAKTGGEGVVPTTTISPVATATTYINAALKQSGIDRDATPEEIKNLTKVLNDAESRFKTTTVGGVTRDLLGNRTQFLANLISTGKYVDPNTGKSIKGLKEDVKKSAAVLGTLSKSAQGLKTDARSLTVQSLQSTARSNGVSLSPQQLDQYALDIQNGKDIKVIQGQIRNIAGLGMPENVKKLLAEGTDLATVYAPYKSQMAAILELSPESINFTDPTLRSAISSAGEMSIYDFQKALRKDARWQYTNNAREDVFQSVSKVLQDFGFQG
jgi:hypothetical protein